MCQREMLDRLNLFLSGGDASTKAVLHTCYCYSTTSDSYGKNLGTGA